MQTAAKTYKFVGKVLPDGHLSIPEDVAKDPAKEFEVIMTPVEDIKKITIRYLAGDIKKTRKFADIIFSPSEAEEIRNAIYETFGTTDVDTVIDIVRRKDPLK
ncbi:MAG: hypothetical protein HY754_11030 [Nitrospirae bacterium]|nr:hypothetical protein [Nitrospirota bacterium]